MSDDLAKRRFMVLSAIRLSGAGLALVGLLVIAGRLGLPKEAGYGLFLAGLFEAMIVPSLLVKGWKSKE
jgi:hypothetical protein